MTDCDKCGEHVSMPYTCERCDKMYCSKHRLPEKHNCSGLHRGGANPTTVVENVRKNKRATTGKSASNKIPNPIPENIRRQLDGRMSFVFLGVIFAVYVLQFIVTALFGTDIHNRIFVLQANNIEYIWTWFTSIFSHSLSSPMHIIGNAIILFFFGRLLEQKIGTTKFVGLFFVAGVTAGLSQIMLSFIIGNPTSGVLGASGALLAVMGALTVYNPRMSVYLYFIIPIPLWLITVGFAVMSVFGIIAAGGFLSNIAHIAHLVGLLIGLAYGWNTKDDVFVSDTFNLDRQMKPRR